MKLKGILITGSSGQTFIRQNTKDGEFRDIKIVNQDLEIVVDDEFAQLREDSEGNFYIDYCDRTLGYK